MRVTVLGSGDATGVPVPTCGCEYCLGSDRRRNPCLLVETAAATVVFDAGPHVAGQLHRVGVTDPDAFLLTHAHTDHAGGVRLLSAAAKFDAAHLDSAEAFDATDPEAFSTDYALYLTGTAHEHLRDVAPLPRIDTRHVAAGETFGVGDVRITPFPVDHARPEYETLGFAVGAGDRTVGYAPDMRGFVDGPPAAEFDLFVCEGSGVLGQPIHGPPADQRAAIESVDADRVVLVNVNEHIQRAHTDELRERAAERGYELGADFAAYEL